MRSPKTIPITSIYWRRIPEFNMNTYRSLRILFVHLLAVLLLSGCSSLDPAALLDTTSALFREEEAQTRPQDIVYEPNESEEALEEELNLLDHSGQWDTVPGPEETEVITETAPADPEPLSDFPLVNNRQVEAYIDLFQTRQHKYFARWLARSGQYLPYIRSELAKAGLPRDLAYLAMIESGFNPKAYSRARAAGMWQFIASTGRNYGLRINSWVDERRDFEKSTQAAIRYLSNLHEEFDDWHLAVAAYNAGEGKIARGLSKYKVTSFWQLADKKYLQTETKRYVPKLIAAIRIAKQPEQYGFADVHYRDPVEYEYITVAARTDLAAIAVCAKTSVKELRRLNTELRRNQTPAQAGDYRLKIPAGTATLVADNMKRLHPVISTEFKTHTISKGDTLTAVCKKYGLSKTILLKANNLRSAKLSPGKRLRIPYRTTTYVLLKEGETLQSHYASKGGNMLLHEIQQGETLSKISKQYNVPVDVIMRWNDISDARRIRAGRQLALFIDGGIAARKPALARARQTPPRQVSADGASQILLTDQKKIRATTAAEKTTVTYRVRNGDSLWTIARKFRVSTKEIRDWNNLNSNMIHPGSRLLIKKG